MNYLATFDIETVRRPTAPALKAGLSDGSVKLDYVTKDIAKMAEKFKDKFWVQAEGSRPVAISFTIIDLSKRAIKTTEGMATNDEKRLTEFVFQTLDEYAPKKLIGFNSKRFDFPILEYMVAHNNPKNLSLNLCRGFGKWDHIDLSEYVPQFFTVYRPLKGSPISVADLYDIPYSKTTGADVATMWEDDLKRGGTSVLDYCKEDTELTAKVFLKMCKLRNFI